FVNFAFLIRFNFRFIATVRRIQRLYEKKGKSWPYWYNIRLRLRMFRDPEAALFDPADCAEIRSAKEELARLHRRMRRFVPIAIAIGFAGFVLCIISAILEYWIRDVLLK